MRMATELCTNFKLMLFAVALGACVTVLVFKAFFCLVNN